MLKAAMHEVHAAGGMSAPEASVRKMSEKDAAGHAAGILEMFAALSAPRRARKRAASARASRPAFLSLFLGTFIASTIFNRPESASYIAILSVSIFAVSILAASQSGFIRFERMKLNSFTLICQAIVNTALSPALAFLGYSVLGAVLGNALSVVAAAFIGLSTFYFILLRPLRKKVTRGTSITRTLKTMLSYGLPLSISTILGGILKQVYAFTIVPLTSNTIYGNYLTAANFSVLLTFLTTPIVTVLFPAFSKLNPEKEIDLIKGVFASSIKYASILLVPATMVLMSLSGPIIGTLYGEKYV